MELGLMQNSREQHPYLKTNHQELPPSNQFSIILCREDTLYHSSLTSVFQLKKKKDEFSPLNIQQLKAVGLQKNSDSLMTGLGTAPSESL